MNKNAIIRNVLVVGGIVVFGMSVYGIYEYYKVQLELLYKFSYKITKVNYISAKNGVLSLQLFVDVTNSSKIAFEISSYDLAIKINNGEKVGKVLNKDINQKFQGDSVNSLNFILEISLVGTNGAKILADILSKGKKNNFNKN